jgi:hypothetical protein
MKLILATQSEYFADFFAKTPSATEVKLPFDSSVVQPCIAFLYLHHIEVANSNVQAEYLSLFGKI